MTDFVVRNGLVVNSNILVVNVSSNIVTVANTLQVGASGNTVNATNYSGSSLFVGGIAANGLVQTNATSTIETGYTFGAFNIGTQSSGTFTPNAQNGNYQYMSSNGAFTWAAPSADCALDVLITNGTGAGAITFSGYTVATGSNSALTTTSTNKFIVSIRRINSISTYAIYALQ